MFERTAFQWWYGWHAGWRRVAMHCLLACALIASARSASALEDPAAPLCDPDAVASGSQIECDRPSLPPVVPPDAAEAPMCDETGASVAARVVIPEVDRGRLEALPCELVLALFGGKKLDFPHASARWGSHRPPAEPAELTLARADAALAPALPMPERTEPHSLLDPLRTGLGACPGHLRPPYRPPLG
jgi:hypothetical protein